MLQISIKISSSSLSPRGKEAKKAMANGGLALVLKHQVKIKKRNPEIASERGQTLATTQAAGGTAKLMEGAAATAPGRGNHDAIERRRGPPLAQEAEGGWHRGHPGDNDKRNWSIVEVRCGPPRLASA